MLLDTREGKVLVNEVAFRIVSEHAPKERPHYVEIRDQYFTDPEHFHLASRPIDHEDDPLGMGEVILLGTLTEAVFPVVVSILSYVAIEVGKAFTGKASEEVSKEAIEWTRSLFSEPKQKPLFTQEQLREIAATIQDVAQTEAERQGIEPVKATTISDSVIARLALAQK